jgi:dihydrofolate reductase
MLINIIVSVSENWVIGKDNKLLWNLKDDLKRFKEITLNKPIIMGQKTFESLPNGALPNRNNIVLTYDKNFYADDTITALTISDALNKAKEFNEEVFIIGGGTIYKQFMEYTDKIYLTVVHTYIEGDTYFPELNESEWKLEFEKFKEKDIKNEYDHTYKIYSKIKNN